MLCLSGFEIYSRWVPLLNSDVQLCVLITTHIKPVLQQISLLIKRFELGLRCKTRQTRI